MNANANGAVVHWQGALLWPQDLPDGQVIDCSGVTALGSWVHAWFRARPQRSVVGAAPAIKRQLNQARLPILWYASMARLPAVGSNAQRSGGVSPDERALLWGAEDE